MRDPIYDIPLFQGVSDDEFDWLCEHSTREIFERGDCFVRQGEVGTRFYVVLEGEMQVTRTINGAETVLGTTPRGIMGGELPLLSGDVSGSTACAITTTRLMVFSAESFRGIFTHVPIVGHRILKTAAERMSSTASRINQQEKMAALGKLSAGLAHELNNPAGAASSSAKALRETLSKGLGQTMKLGTLGLSEFQLSNLLVFQQDAIRNFANAPSLSTMERADREDEIGTWLDELDVPESYDVAATLVDAGYELSDLQAFVSQMPQENTAAILEWLNGALTIARLLNSIENSTGRISEIVRAMKEYTYMDQGAAQEVDIHKGLDTTLQILAYKLKQIEVSREYDTSIPKIIAKGSQLNDLWTNLIDNAVDAMKGYPPGKGRIRIITRCEVDFAMVEINDNGPGIPADVQPRIFEPFFTTKEVGSGTGLGLDTVYRIVKEHRGTIEVQSQPGETRFIVRIPTRWESSRS
jgi:signal transduction histidine kinase